VSARQFLSGCPTEMRRERVHPSLPPTFTSLSIPPVPSFLSPSFFPSLPTCVICLLSWLPRISVIL